MLRFLLAALVCVATIFSGTAIGAEPPLVSLAEAGQHVGEEVAIELVVASSRLLTSGKFCFLNSKKNFSDKDNFTVAIRGAALPKFAEKEIADPAQHFLEKTIRVTGKVSLHQDRPQIIVDRPEQIVVIVAVKTP